MGYYCCVPLCNSNSKRKNGISFHGFTKDKELRAVWLQNIRRDTNSKTHPFRINHHTKICSLHFLKSDFKIASEKWRLKPSAVPTIFAWTNKKIDTSVIKIPTFVPKTIQEETSSNSSDIDEPNEVINEIIDDTSHDSLEIKIEQTESIYDHNISQKTFKEDTLQPEEYKNMYYTLLSENRYLKNELENLSYKYRDQEELYENLVVVNKTTQKENGEFRHTIALLQACLKNTTQKQIAIQKQIFNEPNFFFAARNLQEKVLK